MAQVLNTPWQDQMYTSKLGIVIAGAKAVSYNTKVNGMDQQHDH